MHGLFLLLQAISVILNVIVLMYSGRNSENNTTYLVVLIIKTLIDLLAQLVICYICYEQGSDTGLNRHECFIQRDTSGKLRIFI